MPMWNCESVKGIWYRFPINSNYDYYYIINDFDRELMSMEKRIVTMYYAGVLHFSIFINRHEFSKASFRVRVFFLHADRRQPFLLIGPYFIKFSLKAATKI